MPDLDIQTEDGKQLAALDDLEPWEDNPRDAHDADLERLKEQITDLGQYKPLLVNGNPDVAPAGAVIGGNMRLRALRDLGEDHVWVSVLHPTDEDELLEYALSDNDRVGHYTEAGVAELVSDHDIDIGQYKVDFYAPQDLAQNLAREMNPEELMAMTTGGDDQDDDGDGDGDAAAGDEAGDDTDSDMTGGSGTTPRNLENIGNDATTAMVQLYMTGDEKELFQEDVQELKDAWEEDTTSDIVRLAVEHCAIIARTEADDDGYQPDLLTLDDPIAVERED